MIAGAILSGEKQCKRIEFIVTSESIWQKWHREYTQNHTEKVIKKKKKSISNIAILIHNSYLVCCTDIAEMR